MLSLLESLWRQSEQTKPLQKLLIFRSVWLLLLWCVVLAELATNTPWYYLDDTIIITAIASTLQLFSCLRWWRTSSNVTAIMSLQISIDLAIMTALLAVNGGATNAFVSVLIVPVVFAGVSLTLPYIVAFTAAAIGAYSWLIWQMPKMMVMHEMDMTHHYHGMWVSFLLSVVVVAIVVGTMSKVIAERERAIARQRESQLRQEQLLALGTASAQVTHNIATPLATIALLYDELTALNPNEPVVEELAEPIAQCRHHLDYFRKMATEIREGTIAWTPVSTIVSQLQEATVLHFPEQQLQITDLPQGAIKADGMLLPALLNLIQNGVNANQHTQQNKLELTLAIQGQSLTIELRDFGNGISHSQLKDLGVEPVNSHNGMGIAVMLSNTTIERLGGSLTLTNHPQQGALACVTLPFKALV